MCDGSPPRSIGLGDWSFLALCPLPSVRCRTKNLACLPAIARRRSPTGQLRGFSRRQLRREERFEGASTRGTPRAPAGLTRTSRRAPIAPATPCGDAVARHVPRMRKEIDPAQPPVRRKDWNAASRRRGNVGADHARARRASDATQSDRPDSSIASTAIQCAASSGRPTRWSTSRTASANRPPQAQ